MIFSPVYLTLSALGKISADDILKYFSYISQKTGLDPGFDISSGDNLHEMPNLVFWEKKSYLQQKVYE